MLEIRFHFLLSLCSSFLSFNFQEGIYYFVCGVGTHCKDGKQKVEQFKHLGFKSPQEMCIDVLYALFCSWNWRWRTLAPPKTSTSTSDNCFYERMISLNYWNIILGKGRGALKAIIIFRWGGRWNENYMQMQTSYLSFFLHRDFLHTDYSPHKFRTKTA